MRNRQHLCRPLSRDPAEYLASNRMQQGRCKEDGHETKECRSRRHDVLSPQFSRRDVGQQARWIERTHPFCREPSEEEPETAKQNETDPSGRHQTSQTEIASQAIPDVYYQPAPPEGKRPPCNHPVSAPQLAETVSQRQIEHGHRQV